ncbi:MAG: type II toxin-antitoxin system VapB family antitoxin [Sporichthyaceae bacterium]
MAGLTPIKVGAETDELISHAAHFLGATKKSVVDQAVREYVERHRAEIESGVRDALMKLDGSKTSLLSAMTGMSAERLAELGGVAED